MNRSILFKHFIVIFLFIGHTFIGAQELKPIPLLEPRMSGGKPLMEALKERKSSREFSAEKLPLQVLSDLLWAAFGINRPESERRTAPSAVNWQEIDIYVALEEGLYIYDAKANTLNPILDEDIRAIITMKSSPVTDAVVSTV